VTAALVLLLPHLPAALAAGVQPAGRVYRVGVLYTATPRDVEHVNKALDDGLRELGYGVGRQLVVERRFAEGKQERLPALAAELVLSRVDVIVTGSNPVIAAVKQATTTIPVVMAIARDPVGAGFIASLARPGGNITGLANDPAPEIQGKNVEFLKEAVPRISRVGIVWNPVPPGAETYLHAAESAARRLGVAFEAVAAHGDQELDGAFVALLRARAEGVVVLQDPVFFAARGHIVRLAARHKLPAVYALSEFVEAGGLMSYGVNLAHQFRRAAGYVDKILKGARPGELAVEQAAQFELRINANTAKALGLTIPQSLQLRVDRVIP
jgi:putative ABC transport system substrate-binding protein